MFKDPLIIEFTDNDSMLPWKRYTLQKTRG